MRRRWWLFRLFDLLIYYWPVAKPAKGLLVVRMDGIGDMVLFRTSLDHYAEVFGIPRDEITVVGCDSWQSLAESVFAGYRVWTIDEHRFARRPLYRFIQGLKVRRLAPRIAVSDAYFRRALMADSLVWMARAARTVVSVPYISDKTRPEFTYFLSQADEVIDTGDYPEHEVVRHYRFLSKVGGRRIDPMPPLIDWPENRNPLVPEVPYAVINPGSNEPGRRWPFEANLDLTQYLLDRGLEVVYVGGGTGQTGDPSSRFGAEPRVRNLSGQTTLPDLMDLLKAARVVISNDSGPAHLSLAVGAPTVVVVGGGHFGSFVPYPPEVAPAGARFVHHEMECYHCFWSCHLRKSDTDSFPCVARVSVDQVTAAVEDVIA